MRGRSVEQGMGVGRCWARGVVLSAVALSVLLAGGLAPGDAVAAKRGKLVVQLTDRAEVRVLCPLSARLPNRVSANLARSPVGRCVRVKRRRVVLSGLKATRVVVRSYGARGARPCSWARRGVKAPGKATAMAAGKTKRIRWKVPRLVTAKLRKGALEVDARAVVRVTGDPAEGQTVVLRAGRAEPRVGAPIVVAISARARDGVLGIVSAVRQVGGHFVVSTKPAALDQVYRDLKVRIDSPLGLIPAATGRAEAAAKHRVGPFECETSGPRPQKDDVNVDLAPLKVSFELDVGRRYIHFLLSGTPKIDADASIQAKATCKLTQALARIPNAPIKVSLSPAVEVKTSASLNARFNWRPRIAIGFDKGAGHDQDYRVLNPGTTSYDFSLDGNASLFMGVQLEASVGGRVGLSGQVGPEVSANAQIAAGRRCTTGNASMKMALSAFADVFITHWTFPIASGNFGSWRLFENCTQQNPGGGSPGSGGPNPPGGPGPGGGSPPPPAGSHSPLSAGGGHACAVQTDDTIVCWGGDFYGQSSPPAGSYSSVSAGGGHTCAVRTDDTIACWGANAHGQSSPPAGSYDSVSAGFLHTCAVRTDDTIACWGANDVGHSSPPAGSYSSVSTGQAHTCAVRTNHAIACWGANGVGQSSPPAGSYNTVSAGHGHTCALRTDNTIACWGSDFYGQSSAPAGTYSAVSAGDYHSCAVRADGTFPCWGSSGYGWSDL